jgi:hypothetical protein
MSTKHPDAVALLESTRPDLPEFDPDAPAARARLDDILAAPPVVARQPRRRRTRRLVVAAAATAAAGVAVMLAPLGPGSPDVIARAAAALNDPGTILHLHAEVRIRDTPDEARGLVPDERVDYREETWQTAGARQVHVLHDDGGEFAIDFDARTAVAYDQQQDALFHNTDPSFFESARRPPQGSVGGGTPRDDLAPLVERARNREENLSLTGETTIRGIPVYELRVEHWFMPADERPPRPIPPGYHRLIYVDRERFLPVRVVEGAPGGVVNAITDYVVAERLPRTPQNEGLLRLSPHPGAKKVADCYDCQRTREPGKSRTGRERGPK